MALHPVTVNIPEAVFRQIKEAAKKTRRSVDEVMVEAISAAATGLALPVSQLRSDLAQMAFLNDAALWQAARSSLTPSQHQELEWLHHKQQNEPLTEAEKAKMENLETLYRDTVLVRAQAVTLLKQRNYDVSEPVQFAPFS